MLHRLLLGLILVASVITAFSVAVSAEGPDRISMRTVEGVVRSISHHQGEGDLELLVADVVVNADNDEALQILIAPENVFLEIGFEVNEGDRLRARVFTDAEEPARVQKIQNLTQGTMVRLRTLHRTPLWNTDGTWQGGPMRTAYESCPCGRCPRGGGPPG